MDSCPYPEFCKQNFEHITTELEKIRDAQGKMAVVQGEIQTNLHSLLGNGQPGRISILESKVSDLEDKKNRVYGIISAIGVLWIVAEAALKVYVK